MADWGVYGGGQACEQYGARTDNTSLYGLTTGGVANVKSSWYQLFASTTAFANMMYVLSWPVQKSYDFLIDIAVGPAGSEIVLIPDLLVSSDLYETAPVSLLRLACAIPAGSRISFRAQCTGTSQPITIQVSLVGSNFLGWPQCQAYTTYGANAVDSGATSVDPGGTANVKGAWVEMTASTTRDIGAIVIAAGQRNGGGPYQWDIDVGVGAAGSEVVLIPDVQFENLSNSPIPKPRWWGPFPVTVPAGTRLAVRMKCSVNTATKRLLDIELLTMG
jgi:hypothetical protein